MFVDPAVAPPETVSSRFRRQDISGEEIQARKFAELPAWLQPGLTTTSLFLSGCLITKLETGAPFLGLFVLRDHSCMANHGRV
jgi:hypothetical protein